MRLDWEKLILLICVGVVTIGAVLVIISDLVYRFKLLELLV